MHSICFIWCHYCALQYRRSHKTPPRRKPVFAQQIFPQISPQTVHSWYSRIMKMDSYYKRWWLHHTFSMWSMQLNSITQNIWRKCKTVEVEIFFFKLVRRLLPSLGYNVAFTWAQKYIKIRKSLQTLNGKVDDSYLIVLKCTFIRYLYSANRQILFREISPWEDK